MIVPGWQVLEISTLSLHPRARSLSLDIMSKTYVVWEAEGRLEETRGESTRARPPKTLFVPVDSQASMLVMISAFTHAQLLSSAVLGDFEACPELQMTGRGLFKG
jgi:hypothetical protein